LLNSICPRLCADSLNFFVAAVRAACHAVKEARARFSISWNANAAAST
jgi:hypothetical protein